MKIGILGVGVIGRSIVEGFCYGKDLEHEIYLSPRSERVSRELSSKYENVFRCQDNQAVLDQSEVVFLAILPEHGRAVLESLSFRKEHKVINLMSDKTLDEIQEMIGKTASLNHLVPLSFISKRRGPIALYPKNKGVEALLNKLGQVISVNEVEKIKSMAAITGLMTSYYTFLYNIKQWGLNNHLSEAESKEYTTLFFEALSKHARDEDLDLLANEMTAGGLNEMALKSISQENGFQPWVQALEPIMARLDKKES